MLSRAVDYDALAATFVEEITEDEFNQYTLWSLKNDELSALRLCAPDLISMANGDYEFRSGEGSLQLGWLGHFVKKSTRLESFGIVGGYIFDSCSEQSVDKFLDDLGRCNHIKKMNFFGNGLGEIICKLGNTMKNNNITHLVVTQCDLGVPEATILFNTFRDMKSLEELCIDKEDYEDLLELDDEDMAASISSLAACSGMRKLKLSGLNLSTKSCTALGAIFPRMAALLELDLCLNSINDDCVQVLAQGLSECKQIRSLNLSHNRISDNGLEMLIQGLPSSVDTLDLAGNQVTLARQLPLLRFKQLALFFNRLSIGGPRVIAASLANPECRLESLNLYRINIGDEGVATLAQGLRDNQRLIHMDLKWSNITEAGWNAFSSVLCDKTSIEATYNSNHTLQDLGYREADIPQGVKTLLCLNRGQDKNLVATSKILQTHRHLDMKRLFGRQLEMMPYVVTWLDRFAESRPDLKLSSIFDFVRAMPMEVVEGGLSMKKGKKRTYVVAWLDRCAESLLEFKPSSIFDSVRAMPMEVVAGLLGTKNGKKRRRCSA